MAWVLLIATAALAVLVGALLLRVRRLERNLAAALASRSGNWSFSAENDDHSPHLDDHEATPHLTEYVITRVGDPEPEPEPAPTVPAPVFADLVLKETVVQTASLFHGLRRALDPETRNRIRFHMRQEVKRSRKQRKTELREVRREWAARQRAAMAADDTAAESAA